MRAVSTLRLSERDCELLRKALDYYGYENTATFLRAAAHALIVHHHHRDELEPVLRFKLQPTPSVSQEQN